MPKVPEPRIVSGDVGDNAMFFGACFRAEISATVDFRMTVSDARNHIDELFRAGISMAFPQRDVHPIAAAQPPGSR